VDANFNNKSSFNREPIFLLTGATRLVYKDFERRSGGLGLSRAQRQVLAAVAYMEGEKQISFADKLEMAPIALARTLDQLEQAGLVTRQADPEDRRVRLVYLTDSARVPLQQMALIGEETKKLAFDGFSSEEMELFLRLLAKFCSNLKENQEVDIPGLDSQPGEKRS